MSYDVNFLDIIPQKQRDFIALNIETLSGQLTVGQAKAIARISEKYAKGIIKLTTFQNPIIPWVSEKDIDLIKKELERRWLGLKRRGKILPPVVCSGKPLCTKALLKTFNISETIVKISERFDIPESSYLTIAVSGCFNSCSQPQIHSIGLIGNTKTAEPGKGKRIFGFDVHLGGSPCPFKIGEKTDVFLKEDEICSFFERVFTFASENVKEGETFNKMLERVGIPVFLKEISASNGC